MTKERRLALAVCLAACVGAAAPAAAGPLALDLSAQSGTKVTLSVAPGTVVTFTIFNRLPRGEYTITVEERAIRIPELPTPAISSRTLTKDPTDPCAPILEDAETIGTAADESAVGRIAGEVRRSLGAGKCAGGLLFAQINDWLASTTLAVAGEYRVASGTEVVLTVSRADKVWTFVVSGGARGEWMTSYGIAIVPTRDRPFFAKAAGDDTFVVTAENPVDDVRLIPTAFFTWMSRSQALRSFAIGPTAGAGLTKTRAAVFAGIAATYNWNLNFVAGIAVSSHTRLRGRYAPGDELSESLSDDQLNRDVFRPTWMAAVTFRFGGNPFAGEESAVGQEGQTDEAAQEKKAEKKAQRH